MIRFAEKKDIPYIKELWDIAFGEEPDFNKYFFDNFFNSVTSEIAWDSVRQTMRKVSSPDKVPTTPSQCMESKAAQAAFAIPAKHFTTKIFCA